MQLTEEMMFFILSNFAGPYYVLAPTQFYARAKVVKQATDSFNAKFTPRPPKGETNEQ